MKLFEVQAEIHVVKNLVVEANSESEAYDIAYDICENTPIPVGPEDYPDILVTEVYEVQEEDLTSRPE